MEAADIYQAACLGGIIFKRGGCWPPYQIHLDGEMLNLQPSVRRLFISNHP